MTVTNPTPEYLRPADVAKAFSVHRSTVYRWRTAGLLTIIKRGGMSFIRAQQVRDLIEGRQ